MCLLLGEQSRRCDAQSTIFLMERNNRGVWSEDAPLPRGAYLMHIFGVGNASIAPVGGENSQSLYLICQGVCPPGILTFAKPLGKSTVASPLGISTFMQTPLCHINFCKRPLGKSTFANPLGKSTFETPWEIDFENRPPFKKKGRLQRHHFHIFHLSFFSGTH